ncbi:MAG: prsA [Clostridia bacterium]|jgi:parvulin-like peptidyl-prolyl isomerase|nr:prsA [Clostridia bacterium]
MDEKEKSLKEVDIKKSIKIDASSDKKVITIIAATVIVIALGLFGWFYYNNNLKPVVKFDGGSLTTSEFTIYYKTFAPMLEYYGYAAADIPSQIANKAGVDKILLMKAKEAGITLSDDDKAKVEEIFKDEAQIKKFTKDGIDPNKMKQLYYNDYIITAYIEKIKKDLPDEEVATYLKTTYGETVDMNEFITRHILFSTIDTQTNAAMADDKKAEVKVKAQAALARVLAGEDFAKLAKELSEDTGTKENGGLYKMYLDENTATQYRDAVKTLAVGATTTALVETSYGYHIIKLDEKVAGGRVHSDTDRNDIASKKIDEMGKSMNMKIDEVLLAKVVETITGVKAKTTDDSTGTTDTNTNTNTNTDTTTDTQNKTPAQ